MLARTMQSEKWVSSAAGVLARSGHVKNWHLVGRWCAGADEQRERYWTLSAAGTPVPREVAVVSKAVSQMVPEFNF